MVPTPVRVTCTLYGPLRDVVGEKSLEREVADDATVGDALRDLGDEYPALRPRLFDGDDLDDGVAVLRNGRHVTFEDGLETPLEDGDELSASPPAEGG